MNPSDPRFGKGTARTKAKKRQVVRQKLRAEGYTEEQIVAYFAKNGLGTYQISSQLKKNGSNGAQKPRNPSKKARTPLPEAIPLTDDVIEARLRREGKTDAQVAHIMEHIRFERLCEVHGPDKAAQMRYAEAPEQPDDSKYRPRQVDSVLRGAGRATGDTAKAVKRRRTLAAWEMGNG